MPNRESESTLGPTRGQTWRERGVALLLRVALDALLIDAACETWLAMSPMRTGVAAVTVLYLALTVWVLSQGGRIGGRGWLTDPFAALILIFGLLVAATWTADLSLRGLVLLRQPTPVVLSGSALLLVCLAVYRLAGPPGMRTWWARVAVVLAGVYAACALVPAIQARTPYAGLLHGDAFWRRCPVWLRGGTVATFALLPAAFAREFGLTMSRLTLRGMLRWMLLFGLGFWAAYNASQL